MPVSGRLAFTRASVNPEHSCALTRAGEVHCWGRNDLGLLGDGTRDGRSRPGPVVAPR